MGKSGAWPLRGLVIAASGGWRFDHNLTPQPENAMPTMYDASVPTVTRALTNLVGVLEKAAAHADAKKIEPAVLIGSRLYPDMFPLSRQVQIAADIAKSGVARLAQV